MLLCSRWCGSCDGLHSRQRFKDHIVQGGSVKWIRLTVLLCLGQLGCSTMPKEYQPMASPWRATIPPESASVVETYTTRVWNAVRTNWLPSGCLAGDWVQFEINMDAHGRVNRLDLRAWRASKTCIAAARTAVKISSPLPAPPKAVQEILMRHNLALVLKR